MAGVPGTVEGKCERSTQGGRTGSAGVRQAGGQIIVG